MSAYSDYIVASAVPFRYWPLAEVSGTNADELMANEDATASGMVMGGAASVDGIGGVCPLFTGSASELILLRNAALLGGEPEYTVEIWGYYTPLTSGDIRMMYGEIGTSGNDRILVGAKGSGSSASLRHTYGHDGASATNDSLSVALSNRWVLFHYTRANTGVLTGWWQAGRRMSVTGSTTNTWTNAGLKAALGQTPRSGSEQPWRGRLAHCAVYKRVLTQAEMWAHYLAGTPDASLQRTPPDRNWWKPIKSVWNQRLDDVDNLPTVVAGSVQPTRLANQVTAFGAATNAGGGPFYVVDNSTATQRVRIEGGVNNASLNHNDLYNAFGTVPIPAGFVVGAPTDLEAQIYNEDSDELFEFWVMQQTLLRPEFVTATVSGAGTIPAGTYFYAVSPEDGIGAHGTARQAASTAVVNGSQAVALLWGTSEGVVQYQIWRHITGDANWHVIARVGPSVHSFVDDGSFAEGTGFPSSAATAVTTDWGCSYGGYIQATDDSIGVYEPPHQNWGASATSLPLWGGTVTIAEATASVTDVDAIQHAIAMAVNNVSSTHVYPAQRNDFFSGANNLIEGTRFQLDPMFDISTLANTFQKALAKAFQVFGGIIRDHSAAVTGAYVEDATSLGRDPYPYSFGGKQSFEVLTGFPWSSMRVIDPTWTLTESLPPPNPISGLVDNFADNQINSAVWASSVNATETGGKLHFAAVGATQARLTSISGGGAIVPWTLVGSSISVELPQVAHSTGDQSYLRISSQYETAHCRIEFWVDQTLLRASYTNSAFSRTHVASVTYDPAVHKWLRISESGGVITFDTSVDGASWTLFASFAWSVTGWSTLNLTNIVVDFLFSNFNGTAGRPDLILDNVNTASGSGDAPNVSNLKFNAFVDAGASYRTGYMDATIALVTPGVKVNARYADPLSKDSDAPGYRSGYLELAGLTTDPDLRFEMIVIDQDGSHHFEYIDSIVVFGGSGTSDPPE